MSFTLGTIMQRLRGMPIHWVAAAACALAIGVSPSPAAAEPAVNRPVLVEFFTAQGCDSCRPASHSLAHLAGDRNVLLLTFSVDHWDYLGWRDTHAKPEFSARQRAYARAMGIRGLTTPQVVVNGARAESGAASARVREVIARTPAPRPTSLQVTPLSGQTLSIVIGQGPLRSRSADVWMATYDPSPSAVTPARGEAAGVSVVQHNVVTSLRRLGDWNGRAARFEAACTAACAIIVQEPNGGVVLAVADYRASQTRLAQRP